MVSESTVLVVGAGGSQPYGYPSGSDLVTEILLGLSGTGAGLFVLLKRPQFNFEDYQLHKFREALFESRRYSIDLFLEKHDEFLKIGKAAIAGVLIPREAHAILPKDPELDWYRYLFDRLARNLSRKCKDRLTILTFNYDRSLDHYLFNAFMHSYNLTAADTLSIFEELEIFHLHGSLCTLPWQPKNASGFNRGYGDNAPGYSAQQSAEGIQIVHELNPSDLVFKKAHGSLAKANRIIVLGFGYEETNVRRLFGNILSQVTVNGNIHGTVYGKTHSEAADIKSLFGNRLHLADPDEDCLTFLRNRTNLLS